MPDEQTETMNTSDNVLVAEITAAADTRIAALEKEIAWLRATFGWPEMPKDLAEDK